jgi:signal transduction histidine kinase
VFLNTEGLFICTRFRYFGHIIIFFKSVFYSQRIIYLYLKSDGMDDNKKSKAQLIKEIEGLRIKVDSLLTIPHPGIMNFKQAEKLLHDIIETNPLSIQIVDSEGRSISENKAFIALFLGRPDPDFCLFTKNQLIEQGFEEHLIRLKHGEVVIFPPYTYNANKYSPEFPDNERHLKVIGFPVFGHNRQPEYFVLIHQDITELKQFEQKLQESNTQIQNHKKYIQEAIEKEKKEISMNIHDVLGQQLTGITLKMDKLKEGISDAHLIDKINDAQVLLKNSINTVQQITSKFRYPKIEELGIALAIEGLIDEIIEDTNIKIINQIDYSIETDQKISEHIYRIVQESLTNIVRYAKASTVKVLFTIEDSFILLEISDDGIGISESTLNSGNSYGLIGMKERAEDIGGIANINSKIGAGTNIMVKIPFNYEK